MKKKLLSLMMATAMVATTSVGAFAKDYDFDESISQEAEVQITGDVQDDLGNVLPGTISVSVPTAAQFTVNDKGQVLGTNISVENRGNIPVDVSVERFVDTTGADNQITVVGNNVVTNNPNQVERTKVALNLSGTLGTVYLSSTPGSSEGVYSDPDTMTQANDSQKKILNVVAGGTGKVVLSGDAGKQTGLNTPVRDTFTLTLKIAKSTK